MLAEADRLRRDQHLQLGSRHDHDALLTARSTVVRCAASTWPMTRTTASLIAISMRPLVGGPGGGDGGDGGAGDAPDVATTTGVNAETCPAGEQSTAGAFDLLRVHDAGGGVIGADTGTPASPRHPAIRSRAWRRQPNNCCGESPLLRATSDTFAPGFRLSMTRRALSSSDRRRRRPVPVISSIRRTAVTPASAFASAFVSNVCSSVWSNRSLMARHQATAVAGAKCGGRAPLTIRWRATSKSRNSRRRCGFAARRSVGSRVSRCNLPA